LVLSQPANATEGWAAQAYINAYWNDYNTSEFNTFSGDDCTNFASQVDWYANEAEPDLGSEGYYDPSALDQWWYYFPYEYGSNSWGAVQNRFDYLDYGGGPGDQDFGYAYWWGIGAAPSTTGQSPGDLYMYNWDDESDGEGYWGLNHASVDNFVGYSDNDGTYGNEVGAHDNNHRDDFYTFKFVSNPDWRTESVWGMHITD
jgi:hypothetical protein